MDHGPPADRKNGRLYVLRLYVSAGHYKRGHRTEPPLGKYYTMLRPTADVYFGQIWLCRHIRLQNISLNVHT